MNLEQKNLISLEQAIKDVVNYYGFFNYAPSLNEIYTFLTIKTSKKELEKALNRLITAKKIKKNQFLIRSKLYNQNSYSYTIPSQRILERDLLNKRLIAQYKLAYTSGYIKIIKLFPQVKLVGVSGTLSMSYADPKDDVDLFVASSSYRLWTARFICVFIASIMGLRRKRGLIEAPNKICLNMFFDESDLSIPEKKRNLYTAHEVLQMKPLIVKDDSYDRFLTENKWVYDYFPNVKKNKKEEERRTKKEINFPISSLLESILRRIQLWFIKKHQTSEIITNTQLWFFPEDFEQILKRKKVI